MNASGKRENEVARLSGELLIGDDFLVARLGLGTMRLTGKGIWGEPSDRSEAIRVVRRELAAAPPRPDRSLSVAPDRPKGPDGEAARRPEGFASGGQDQAHRS